MTRNTFITFFSNQLSKEPLLPQPSIHTEITDISQSTLRTNKQQSCAQAINPMLSRFENFEVKNQVLPDCFNPYKFFRTLETKTSPGLIDTSNPSGLEYVSCIFPPQHWQFT